MKVDLIALSGPEVSAMPDNNLLDALEKAKKRAADWEHGATYYWTMAMLEEEAAGRGLI